MQTNLDILFMTGVTNVTFLFALENITLTHCNEIIFQKAASCRPLGRPCGQKEASISCSDSPKHQSSSKWLHYLFDTEIVAFQFVRVFEKSQISKNILLNRFGICGMIGSLNVYFSTI